MKLWRVLLTLLFITFAIVLFGYYYLNQQINSMGITDWNIEFEKLTANHIIVNRLEVTIDSLQQSTNGKLPTALNLTEILSTQIPAIIPERIHIKSLRLNGTLLPDSVSATLKLQNQDQLLLQITSHQPISATLEMTRENGSVELKAHYDSAVLNANYDYNSGKLNADGSYLLEAHRFADSVNLEQLPVNAQWKGTLLPHIESASMEGLASALSGQLLLSVRRPTTIKVAGSSTTATGQLKLNVSNGIIDSYKLKLDGDTKNLTSLAVPELPVQLESVAWNLNSRDQLKVPLLNIQKAENKTHWPANANAVVKGMKNETLDISSELSVRQKQWEFKLVEFANLQIRANSIELPLAGQPFIINKITSSFSGKLSTNAAEFHSIEPTNIELNISNNDVFVIAEFSKLHYPYLKPHEASAEFDVNIHSDAVSLDPLRNFKAAFNSEFRYHKQQLSGHGELLLGEHIRVQHHSQINATQLKADVKVAEFDWQQVPQLSTLLKQVAPQFVVNKATVSAQTNVTFSWDNSYWQFNNGRAEIEQGDWVADTLSVVDSNLAFEFSANNEQLDIDNAQVDIASMQLGFALGPVTAKFGLQLPFQHPFHATLNLTSHSIKALGGRINVPNQSYSLANSFTLPVVFKEISLGELMRQYPSNNVSIDGEISGTIPLHWDSKQLTVERGYLDALAPGGHLQVDSSALVSVAGSNPSLQTLAGVLSNFYYQKLSAVVDYDQDGELLLALQLKGSNPEVENGRPVELNINLEEDLPALIKGLTLSNSLNEIIRKRIQQKIN